MNRLGQRVGLVGRGAKRGARLDPRRHELVPLVGAPVNRSVAKALDSDPGKSALEFREGRRRRSIAEFGRARELIAHPPRARRNPGLRAAHHIYGLTVTAREVIGFDTVDGGPDYRHRVEAKSPGAELRAAFGPAEPGH